jgi:hypothetical protein
VASPLGDMISTICIVDEIRHLALVMKVLNLDFVTDQLYRLFFLTLAIGVFTPKERRTVLTW